MADSAKNKRHIKLIVELIAILAFLFIVFVIVKNADSFVQPYVEIEGNKMAASEWAERVKSDPAKAEEYIGKEITVVGRILLLETEGRPSLGITYRTAAGERAEDLVVNAYLVLEGDVAVEVSTADAYTLQVKTGDLVQATGVIAGYQIIGNMETERAVVLDDLEGDDGILHTHLELITNLGAFKYLLPL